MPSQSPLRMQQQHGLQGPRPATLKVSKKRQPVIIYVESPKVVHAHPGEFKSVVQRLTGAPPSSSMAPPASLPFPFQLYGGQMAVAPPPLVAPSSSMYQLPADAVIRSSLGSFISDDDQLMIKSPAAGPAGAAANPALPSSTLGACYYHGGDISLRQPPMTNDDLVYAYMQRI